MRTYYESYPGVARGNLAAFEFWHIWLKQESAGLWCCIITNNTLVCVRKQQGAFDGKASVGSSNGNTSSLTLIICNRSIEATNHILVNGFLFNISVALLISRLLYWIPSACWSNLISLERPVCDGLKHGTSTKSAVFTGQKAQKNLKKRFCLFVVSSPANGVSGLERVSTGVFTHIRPEMKWLQVCEWRRAWCLTADGQHVWGWKMTSCQTHGCRSSGGGPPWMAKQVSYINHAASFHCDNHYCVTQED